MKIKMARGALLLGAVAMALLFWGAFAHAGVPFWQAPQASTTTAYGTGYLAGSLKVYPSTSTAAAAPSIFMNGPSRELTVRNGASVSSMTSAGFFGNGAGLTGVNANTATLAQAAVSLNNEPAACSAGEYVTDISSMGVLTCATPEGAGDVVLASTQTFTWQNTFSNSVTVSSLTIVGGGITGVHRSSVTYITATYTSATAGFTTCAAGSTITITTNGGPVLVGTSGWWENNTINEFCVASYLVDGAGVIGTEGLVATKQEVAGIYQLFSFTYPTLPLSAGVHTFCLSFRLQGGGSCSNLVNPTYTRNPFWVWY